MTTQIKQTALTLTNMAAGAILYGCLAVGAGIYEAIAPRPFDPVAWQAIAPWEDDRRYPMVEDLLESEILLNRSRREVLGLLGQPSVPLQDALRSPQWRYRVGSGFSKR